MQSLHLTSFSYDERTGLLPQLTEACTDSGAWLLDHRNLSATAVELSLEIQLDAIVELYSGLIAAGLELSRTAHAALTDLCLCRRHHETMADLCKIITIRLEISFLDTITLQSILTTGAALA